MSEDVMVEWAPLEETVPAEVLRAEIAAWARRIGVEPRGVRIRHMTHKWASCSSLGNVTFNDELMSQPAEFRARAIVHELLHLRVPNHGKLFNALMGSYLAGAGEAGSDATLACRPEAGRCGPGSTTTSCSSPCSKGLWQRS